MKNRRLRKLGVPVRHDVEKDSPIVNPKKQASVAALEKKRVVLGALRDEVKVVEEAEESVDVEELEKKEEKLIVTKNWKAKAKKAQTDKTSGTSPKKNKRGEAEGGGGVFYIIPNLINKHYGRPNEGITGATLKLADIIRELTGNTLTAWPTKGQLQASSLSLRYVVLYKVVVVILVPTSNNTNIVDHSNTGTKLKSIDFPSLLCSLMITQQPEVLKPKDGHGEDAK
ncbi:hypothetical protein LIER_42016 [Lithospermum erythrorhizon]|uniref:Uncharacterized protein n=1 Tax=Lithospermum erythrorhizon TaxID=34254 RepID=A0AAV3RI39_LITER